MKLSALPENRTIVPVGYYMAKIVNCRVRTAKTSGKPNLNFLLKTDKGTLWDQISDSENENAQYKARRLLEVTGILTELPDDCTLEMIGEKLIAQEREIGIYVVHQQDLRGKDRAVVGFQDPIYLNKEELEAALAQEAEAAALLA